MKNGILISAFFIFSTLIYRPVFSCDIHGKTGFMPENNLRISKFDKNTNGMTQPRFEAIIKSVSDAYVSIVAEKGATLQMINKWDDDTVNAYASRDEDVWQVSMFGGLARHPLITDDGFRLVVCHETGHHLGGAPKYDNGLDWAATEGQADYFGALKCMRRVLEKEDNSEVVAKMVVDEEATKKCKQVYKNENEVALCQRISMAGKSLGELLGSFAGNTKINFNTPDKKIVKKTYESHPQAQCRLDTYFNGTLCDKSFAEDVSETSPIPGTCIKRDGYKVGMRPLCWYKPSNQE